jgi:O-antigen ligase
MRDYNESFPHPHNVYLEWLLDNGIIGFIPVAAFFGMVIIYSVSLFRDSSDPSYVAVGGCALALVVAQLVAGIGAQHFYPRESTLGMWAAIFLMLRVHVERQRAVSRVLQYAVARAPLIPGGLIPAGVR